MDEFESRLKNYFKKNIDVPNQCKNALRNTLYINKKSKKNYYSFFLRQAITIASVGSVFICGVAFATNFNNIRGFFGLGSRN